MTNDAWYDDNTDFAPLLDRFSQHDPLGSKLTVQISTVPIYHVMHDEFVPERLRQDVYDPLKSCVWVN